MVMAETGSGDSNYHEYIENVYVLSETLDGYEEISRTDGKRMVSIEYGDSNQNMYVFYQLVDTSLSSWIDNDSTLFEKCDVANGVGYFQNKDKINSLIWSYDGYVFKLLGDIPREDMISLANSLSLE